MIRTAVIGVGYLGKFHAEKFATAPGSSLVAVVDKDAARVAEISERHGCLPLRDYRDLSAHGIHCASVASDTTTHFEIASWLLQNGIDVLVEKPMAASKLEALTLVELARNNGRILQVGHLERFNPAFRAVRERLTHPRFFEARRISPFTGRAHDVDVVLDLMIHDIDIVSHLVGRPLSRLEAVGVPVLTGSIDVANARLWFEGGAIANVTASRAATHSERTIKIFQPNVYISLDYGNKKIKIVRRLEEKDAKGFHQMQLEEHAVEERDALRDEIHAFLDCVRNRSAPDVSGEDGVRALELAELIRAEVAKGLDDFLQNTAP